MLKIITTCKQKHSITTMKLKKLISLFFSTIVFFSIISCKTPKEIEAVNVQDSVPNKNKLCKREMLARPPVIIYKTSKDYFNNIPVGLSEDKTVIISYPDIQDIYYQGEPAYPTRLAGGYLLDNRGIGLNSAFIKYTYQEYSRLNATPSAETLYNLIIDKNPFTEIYLLNCKKDTSEINKLIFSGLKENCKKIK